MKVFTYFQPIGESSELIKQKLLLEYWAKDWGSQGWQPIVLNEEDAATHSYYKDYKKEIKKIKTTNSFAYEEACMLRHLAISEKGGGLLVDYDVFNIKLTSDDLPRSPCPIILGLGVPCAVWSSAAGFEMLCKSMAPYCGTFSSDMHIIQHLKVPGVYACREFPDSSGKMIHFPAGRIGSDKLEFIQAWLEKNRPLQQVIGS